ncbi:MAG: hypothetical protein HDKAJFGB_01053 [Anaerolineae bacterium]|nr:hypothetical protein [Anaerolineae bacterium]
MEGIVNTLSQYMGAGLARLIAAVLALLVGWLIAALVAGVVKALLKRVQLDKRVAKWTESPEGKGYPVEEWTGKLIFWFIFLFFVVGALEVLNFTQLAAPINNLLATVTAWLPALLGAGILALIAHVVGTVLRKLTVGLLERRKVDERLAESSGSKASVGKPLGDAVYYLVWLLFLPAILGTVGLQGLLVPVQNMIDQFLSFLPYLAAAVILLIVGWFVARIVQRIVAGFLASAGVDAFAERVGIAKYMGGTTVSTLLGLIVFILILIPVITAALDALNLDSLTAPLTAMMNEVITAIPNYVAAAALLVITFVLARWFIGILVEILTGVGVNSIPRALGIGESDTIGKRTLAQWIGDLVLVVVMMLAAVQAAQIIGWTAVTLAIGALGTQIVLIVFGLVIIAIGVYLGNLAAKFINGTTMPNKSLLALVARVSIIAFAGAMGLTTMGFAEPIVILAFGLFFGAIAVAVALAFGLGGRETASKRIAAWSESLAKDEKTS